MRHKIILALSMALAMVSCELDNYSAPGGCISGRIVDSGTGKPIPLPVESSNGAVISLMEVGTGATLAQSFYAKFDGSFRNANVFEGVYDMSARGPFKIDGSVRVNVEGETVRDISAVPYSRIEVSVSLEGKAATVNYEVTPVEEGKKVSRVYIFWNLRKETDIQVGNYANIKTDLMGKPQGSHTFNFENEIQYAQNLHKIRENGGRVFLRVAAECDGNVNYSEVMEITIQ